MWKKKITRIIALVISLVMVGGIAYEIGDVVNMDYSRAVDRHQWLMNDTIAEEETLYRKLWCLSVMYLRYLDENGEFTGSNELKQQTVSFLRDIGAMDEKGNIALDCPDNIEYYVSFGDRKLSHGIKGDRDDFTEDLTPMTFRFLNGKWSTSYSPVGEYNWFETDYGMSYYYYNGCGTALFDYDISGLDSYTDELGATIYYKLDGTTPIPAEYLETEWEHIDTNKIKGGLQGDFVLKNGDAIQPTEAVTEPKTEPETEPETEEMTEPQTENVTENVTEPVVTAVAERFNAPGDNVQIQDPHSDSDYYYDRLGRLWYKGELIDDSTYSEFTSEDGEIIEQYDIEYTDPENGLYYYNSENGGFFRVVEPTFNKTRGDDSSITILIRPDAETIGIYNDFHAEYGEWNKEVARRLMNLIPAAIIAFIMMAFFLVMGGFSDKDGKFVMGAGDRILAEFPAALIGAGLFGGLIFLADTGSFRDACELINSTYGKGAMPLILSLYYVLIVFVVAICLNTLIVRIKCRSLLKTSLCGIILIKLWHGIKGIFREIKNRTLTRDMLRNDKFTRSFILHFAILIAMEFIILLLGIGTRRPELVIFCSVIVLALFFWLNMGDLKAMKRLNEHISAMHDGDYSDRTEPEKSPIYCPTEKLNRISEGIQTAVERQIKSERMKIDLVTNVSHDLKTPLTSIISYIDLLQTEELTPEARDYVQIISNKSDRLKTMVADLFDLAKATSRTDVAVEKIDAVILTRQVLGDLEDKIAASGREIRTDITAETAPIEADGKKLYRVFQNLIDNALKYSLEGTRIYVTLTAENGECSIKVKNIASYEMTFKPDEITERFTRGDESRSTEGNGLGLSIAKSFTEASGGTFSVTIDGDLFTAEMRFPTHVINA